MPRWWGHVNKRLFNPRAVRSGRWPVLEHVGRRTGAVHRTPMDAHPVDGGYLFVPVYGPHCDWVRNVLVAGRARLQVDGREVDLVSPRLVDAGEAFAALADDVPRPPDWLRITAFLRMDLAPGASGSSGAAPAHRGRA